MADRVRAAVILAVLAGGAVIAFQACSGPDRTASDDASAVSGASGSCNAGWSKRTATAARANPEVRDVAVRPDGLHIVFSARAWGALKLDERDRLVSAFDCAIAGPGYLKAVIVEDASGAVLKSYGPIELAAARQLQP